MESLKVGNRKIGRGEDLFFIAEIGINHNGELALAKKMVDAAAAAGCDAAKFQTFTAKALYMPEERSGTYKLMGKDIPIYDLHVKLEMPEEWIGELQDYCRAHGLIFFSTPVDGACVDLLDRHGVPLFKVSSYDMTNIPLIRHLTTKKKPVVFSCGGADMAEVAETADMLRGAHTQFAIMHCIAKYPAPYAYANLAVMETLRLAFDVPVGFSDNGFCDEAGKIDSGRVPMAAAKCGADLFEIHTTIDRKLPGPDHAFATEPDELKKMVADMRAIRAGYNCGKRFQVEPLLLGSSRRMTYEVERYVRDFAYKCLFSTKRIAEGERLTIENVGVLRPGAYPHRGLAPRYHELVVSKARARVPIEAWQPITWDTIL
ncbi:MAG: N-acetylneuraminate synthase family protein [Candidatus Micrarchaeota archaeon]